MLGAVDVGGEKLSELTSPVCSQQPGCSERNRFLYSLGFPESQGPVDGVDSVRTLRFSQVVGEASNEVTSIWANLIGAESFFHVKSLDRIATEVLDNLPKLNSATKKRTVQSSPYLCRCGLPS